MGGGGGDPFKKIGNSISSGFNSVGDTLSGSDIQNQIQSIVNSSVNSAIQPINKSISTLQGQVNSINGSINGQITNATNQMQSKINGTINTAINGVHTQINQVKSTVSQVEGEVVSLSKKLESEIKRVIDKIQCIVTQVANAIANLAKQIGNAIVKPIIALFKGIGDIFVQIFTILQALANKIASLPGCIPFYMIDTCNSIFQNIIRRFIPGFILDFFNTIYNWTLGIFVKWFLNFIGWNDADQKCYNFNVNSEIQQMSKNLQNIGNAFTSSFGSITLPSINC